MGPGSRDIFARAGRTCIKGLAGNPSIVRLPHTTLTADGGQNGRPGSGTGEDISRYYMSKFTVSPGKGGQSNGDSGGGGGGVLGGGKGPSRNQYQGEGYGGGGASEYYNQYASIIYKGLPGVILVEVV